MAGSYRHILQYEKEMLELKADGLTVKEIGERFGLSYEQARGFFKRHNRKERKIAAGIALKKKGRPPKDDKFAPTDMVTELGYIIARKFSISRALIFASGLTSFLCARENPA